MGRPGSAHCPDRRAGQLSGSNQSTVTTAALAAGPQVRALSPVARVDPAATRFPHVEMGCAPFTTSATETALTEPACTTGDTLCWCVLYSQEGVTRS